jgi:hypothetical protein
MQPPILGTLPLTEATQYSRGIGVFKRFFPIAVVRYGGYFPSPGGLPTPLLNILHERDNDLTLLAPEGHTDL